MLQIRPFTDADWPALHPILQRTCEAGDTLAFMPGSSEAVLRAGWVDAARAVYVACDDGGAVVGSYYLRTNQPGLGSHVGNAGYVVDPEARGRGIAAALCEHSQREARSLGYRALQFNFVVSTNEVAVRLWQRHGFAIVGTLPGAYRHATLGYVDAYVMFKSLVA